MKQRRERQGERVDSTQMNFQDRVVLITGASNGIGRRLAVDLAARGAIVVGCGRSLERLQATSAEMQRTSPLSTAIQCDVGELDQVRKMITEVLSKFGKIDILINNAGIGMRKPFAEMPIDVIEELMRTNYLGAVYCTHELLPSMIARRSGHIVNISSAAGKIGTLNIAGYCASKFAMNGLSESLYYESLLWELTYPLSAPVRCERTSTNCSPTRSRSLLLHSSSARNLFRQQ